MQFLVLPERSTAIHIIQVHEVQEGIRYQFRTEKKWSPLAEGKCVSKTKAFFFHQTNTDINFDPSEIKLTHNLIIWT